ncbi:hypothetical protein WN943_029343 [Citrus x changshan-huyou]
MDNQGLLLSVFSPPPRCHETLPRGVLIVFLVCTVNELSITSLAISLKGSTLPSAAALNKFGSICDCLISPVLSNNGASLVSMETEFMLAKLIY